MLRHIALEPTPTATCGQLVTTRSTRHTLLGCDELTMWRVDW